MYTENAIVDQFHCKQGVTLVEDIVWQDTITMNMNLASGGVQTIPVTFEQAPIRSFNQVPTANTLFLVLRHLDIASQRPVFHRESQWQWVGDADTTFSATAGGGTAVVSFLTGPVPSNTANGLAVPLALRRIQMGTVPAGVTITKIEVKPHWAATYDDLHVTSPFTTSVDLGTYYDQRLGLVNDFITIGAQTQIDVRFTYGNSGATTNVPFQFYGTQKGLQWGQWLIQFQPSYGGIQYNVGHYDDVSNPFNRYQLDELIPIQINDTGITNIGSLLFTSTQQIPYYATTSLYDIMFTATIAYLVQT